MSICISLIQGYLLYHMNPSLFTTSDFVFKVSIYLEGMRLRGTPSALLRSGRGFRTRGWGCGPRPGSRPTAPAACAYARRSAERNDVRSGAGLSAARIAGGRLG